MKILRDQRGAALVLEIVLVAVVLGIVGWALLSDSANKAAAPKSSATTTPKPTATPSANISWSFNGAAWSATGTPPKCPDPLTIPDPIDLSHATAILYPGQYRGGDYKSHGGFIFAGSANNAITVKVPTDAVVYKAARYIEAGETQYLFVLIAPCGVMYRFDHLATLSPEFQKLADVLPAAKSNDSSTTNFSPTPAVKAGSIIATGVGFAKTHNTSLDFGVYDLRAKNAVSQTATWQKAHSSDNEFGAYGICWLDNLPATDKTTAKALPGGDGAAGKQSDYCKS